MNARKRSILAAISLALLALLGLLGLMGARPSRPALAEALATTRYVAGLSGSDTGGCDLPTAPCRTIQYAIDQADPEDEIWIAYLDNGVLATYTGGGDNVFILTESLALRGGYTYLLGTWSRIAPLPTPVDGQGVRRVAYVSGEISPTLEFLALINGQALQGGNLYAEDVNLQLVATPILSGNASYGGGLYLKNCQTSFDPGEWDWGDLLPSGLLAVVNNSADYGGGLYVEGGSPILAGLGVYSNAATLDGGGLYLQGGHPIIAGGLIQENWAENRGGGFFLADSTAYVAGAAVYSNTAAEGAGFYLDGPFTLSPLEVPILANNYIRHNQNLGGSGGGLYLRQAMAGLANNVIADNAAAEGAGLYLWASSPRLYHNTLAQNEGDDGVHLTHRPGQLWPPVPPVPSLPAFTNTIVVSHAIGVYVDSTGLPYPLQNRASLDGTLWWGNGEDTAGPGEVIDEHPISGDPRFTCLGDPPDCPNPYHILTDSAALDTGVSVTLPLSDVGFLVDIDLQLRPSGPGFDIGADELVSQTFGVWLAPSLSRLAAAPGQTVTHTHWLLNTGVETDTYDLSLSSGTGWASLVGQTPITLNPQTSATVWVRVSVPPTATSDMSDTAWLTATSQSDPLQRAGALDLTSVVTQAQTDLALGKWADRDLVFSGRSLSYTLLVTNAGPLTETLLVTLNDQLLPVEAVAGLLAPEGCAVDVAQAALTCSLSLSQNQALWLWVTTTQVYSGLLVNSGSVQAGGLIDPNPLNNLAQATVLVTPCQGLDSVSLAGPTSGYTDTRYTFTAAIVPSDATQPISYTWSPEPVGGQDSPTATYQWAGPGVYTLTVTAENCGGVAQASQAITIAAPPPGCPHPLEGVSLAGPTSGYTDTRYAFTATIVPSDATQPVSYTWSPEPVGGQDSPTATYRWAEPGSYSLTLTAENCGGVAQASQTITIASPPPGCPRPLEGVSLAGPTSGYVDTRYTFTATVVPSDATQPVSYTWSPEPIGDQGSPTATYRWAEPGSYSLTLTAENCGGVAQASQTITIAAPPPGCPRPLEGVSLAGPTSGYVDTRYTFTATVVPSDATQPVSYTWSPEPVGSLWLPGKTVASYTWPTTGSHTVIVTAFNCGGAVSATQTLNIQARSSYWVVYLPVVMRED